MIRAIIHDIGNIIDNLQKQYSFDAIVYHLDADVKYYLHNAFLDNRIYDFTVQISKGPDRIHLNVQVKETTDEDWDYLGFAIERSKQNITTDYDRAMRGI